ncbi:MAG: hypothetical protein ABL955_05305, partial [Elusimicrobiota bacterium]
MVLSLAALILAPTVVSARAAEAPARPSAVRQALVDTLGAGADAAGKKPSFGALVNAMSPELRAAARARLDALDRESLSPAALTDLSKVYVLLGAHDPKGTRGLVLAADAKLAQKDYAASAALAEQALKINPSDFDARRALETARGRIAPTSSANSLVPSGGQEQSQAPPADTRPLRPASKLRPGEAPPAPLRDEPAPATPGGAPWWLTYAMGGGLLIYGAGLTVKHALERGKGGLEQTAETAGKNIDNLNFKGKDFFQKNPKTAVAVCVGGAVAVLIGGVLIAPTLGLGGGATLLLATEGGGTAVAAATASGVGVGALKITAVAAAAAAPLLMSGDANSKTDDAANTEKEVQPDDKSLDNPESLRGADRKQIENLVPKDWVKGPMRKGLGTRYLNPKKPGQSILIEDGWPGATDPLHRGPYVRISRNG